MKRHDRLIAMLAEHGVDGLAEFLRPSIDKWGLIGALDRWRLPLIATPKALRGEPFKAPERNICGARTRTGAPCKRKPISGKRRCRNHGGLSTGPRTPEGQARAKANLLLRWTR